MVVVGLIAVVVVEVMSSFEERCLSVTELERLGVGCGRR